MKGPGFRLSVLRLPEGSMNPNSTYYVGPNVYREYFEAKVYILFGYMDP